MAAATASQDMQFFSTLVRCGSLAAAARELQVSPPAVSKRLAALEARLGVSLLSRTTRRAALTPEGATCTPRARCWRRSKRWSRSSRAAARSRRGCCG